MTDLERKLREMLEYDPQEGVLRWRVTSGRAHKGKVAGTAAWHRYATFRMNGKFLKVHRVAWFLYHGAWPSGFVDHIDGDKLNNRIDNLRDVTPKQNRLNVRKARADSETGVVGVRKNGSKFEAVITLDRKMKVLGRFDTLSEASSAYGAAHFSAYGEYSPYGTGASK